MTPTGTVARSQSLRIRWDGREVLQALRVLDRLQHPLLERLADLLNEYLGWSRSTAYYDLVCGDWLYHLAHQVYAAHLDVTRARSVDAGDETPAFVFAEPANFRQALFDSPAFYRQLCTVVARRFAGRPLTDGTFTLSRVLVGVSSSARRLSVASLTAAFASPAAPVMFCRPNVACTRREWVSTLWAWRRWARHDDFEYSVPLSVDLDRQWRLRMSAEMQGDDLLSVASAVLPLYLPVVFVEGFEAFRRKALALGVSRPHAVFSATGWHEHTLFKMLAAEWREEGTRILARQHGGGYGLGAIEPNERYEIRVSDVFYSFGWLDDGGTVRPLPQPMPATGRPRSDGRVLLTTLSMPQTMYRIHFAPMPGTIETMMAEVVSFVGHFPDRARLVVRPHIRDFGCGLVAELRNMAPDLRFDDLKDSGPAAFVRSALVVHSYLGSAWLETLALDVPTVCFYDPEIYLFRDDAQPFIRDLEAVSVLHRSGADAARFVASIADVPSRWWRSPGVRSARQAFTERYASFSRDWARSWSEEFAQWA